MTDYTPEVVEALRLPELYRQVCAHAGVPLPQAASAERFVFRSGAEPPGLLAELLEEALLEDLAEAEPAAPAAPEAAGPGHVVVLPGFDGPCPNAEALCRAAHPAGGNVIIFAVERWDAAGRLRGVTWVAVPEEEPAQEEPFRAAVLRLDIGGGGAA